MVQMDTAVWSPGCAHRMACSDATAGPGLRAFPEGKVTRRQTRVRTRCKGSHASAPPDGTSSRPLHSGVQAVLTDPSGSPHGHGKDLKTDSHHDPGSRPHCKWQRDAGRSPRAPHPSRAWTQHHRPSPRRSPAFSKKVPSLLVFKQPKGADEEGAGGGHSAQGPRTLAHISQGGHAVLQDVPTQKDHESLFNNQKRCAERTRDDEQKRYAPCVRAKGCLKSPTGHVTRFYSFWASCAVYFPEKTWFLHNIGIIKV